MHSLRVESLSLLAFASFGYASPLFGRSSPDFVFPGDAPFTTPTTTLSAALTCPFGNPTANSPPVLLVHGTGSTGQETWGEGYVPALQANGYTPCYVTLPQRALGDMQISSEYIAYAIHQTSYLSNGLPISIVTHSQGGPDTQWALQFWPSTRSITRAFAVLSPDFAGIDLFGSALSNICIGDLCQASIWQQSAGSNYYGALHDSAFEALVPTTVIWTAFDGVVTPPADNAQLPSATVISVQDLCPGRLTNHLEMPIDSAAFAIALDALNNGGIASLARVQPQALEDCLRLAAPGMSVSVAASLQDTFNALVNGFLISGPRVTSEPPLQPYA